MTDPLAESGSNQREPLPWKLILLLLVVVALAIFFFQNSHDAQIEFLWGTFSWPLWAVIGISVLAGIVIDRLGSWQWRRARRRRDQARR